MAKGGLIATEMVRGKMRNLTWLANRSPWNAPWWIVIYSELTGLVNCLGGRRSPFKTSTALLYFSLTFAGMYDYLLGASDGRIIKYRKV